MSNPIQRLTIDDASEPTAGSSTETLGHTLIGMWAAVDGDPSGIEIQLEGSPDRERWASLDTPVGDPYKFEEEDFNECPDSGVMTAFGGGQTRGLYIRYIRARLVEAPAEGSADVYLLGAGNTGGKGARPTQKRGPATDL